MGTKLRSRKFWIAVAAGLGSIGTSIAGLATENEVIAATGIICATASAAIYAAAEAYVDGASAKANGSETQTVIQATTSRDTADKLASPPVIVVNNSTTGSASDGDPAKIPSDFE